MGDVAWWHDSRLKESDMENTNEWEQQAETPRTVQGAELFDRLARQAAREREGGKPDLNHTNWGNGSDHSDHSD